MASIRWLGALALSVSALLAACGGTEGGGTETPAPVTQSVHDKIAAAAAVSANDTSTNHAAPFTVLQDAGVAAVDTSGATPVINFSVFDAGAVKQGLALADVSVIMAKLVPGTNGNPDQWQSYTYRKETAAAGAGPNGTPVLASAMQATTDGKQTVDPAKANQLVYNADGYYTYTFKTNIKDTAQTNGVTFEPGLTHRVAIQLKYTNAAGETVLVNPYYDFTVGADGKAVAVTNKSATRVMADVSSCNGCHDKLALHGGGRVDTQYCVMCHNPGTTDANSGNVLTMSTMVHKIHAGKRLAAAAGGEDYTIWGYQNSKHDYAEVGFPQDLRNCAKCHSASNAATPQGDNWKTVVSKEACLTCHASGTGSAWLASHTTYASGTFGSTVTALGMTNQQCAQCHKAGSALASDRVHWNQNEENSAKYKMVIDSATYDATNSKVTVKYALEDPTNGNQAYNLVTSECTGTTTITCANTTKFGNLRLYVAYQNMVGQPTTVTEYTSYNNGGSVANAYAYKGTNDGNNRYTIDIPIPADTATAKAFGTARVITIGQIKEPLLKVKSAADPRPEETPRTLINTVVQNTFKEFALSGALQPRRIVVSNEKCNVCHGALGTTSGSNTLANAFHGGARDTVEACVMCHDVNRASTGNMMTNGLNLYENYGFKNMVHGIHGNSKRTYPFTHGNKVVGEFNKDGTSATGGAPLATTGVENYAAEVAWPGVGVNCNACHVNNSYMQDRGPLGNVVFKDTGVTDPMLWKIISPKAASCVACHDSAKAVAHVTDFGNASYGNKTQKDRPQETCDDCHSSGGFRGVDIVHGLK